MNANDIIGNPHTAGMFSRRDMLQRLGAGFGTLGLAGLVPSLRAGGDSGPPKPHFAPRAKRIIQLFMPGGPSHVDTFDHKPDINRHAGKRPKEVDLKSLRNTKGGLQPSPFKFAPHGQTGKYVSEVFPHTAKMVDEICFIHSMHTDIPEHAGGILMMNIGHVQPVRPSVGSWMLYGLGTENNNLPGFVSLSALGTARGGKANWGNCFLPSTYAGCKVDIGGMKPERAMADLRNSTLSVKAQREQADLITRLNQLHLERRVQDSQLEAGIASMELAFRMQSAVPEAFDIKAETESTRKLYGDNNFSKGCLLARRLAERGVRYIQVAGGNDIAWDTHGNTHDIRNLARNVDQGIAGLLRDLKARGMLDETLVIWTGEFGRAPTSEGAKGRDHNHYGFTTWLAGGGVKAGYTYGATDRFGMRAVENRTHVHDLHATMLHLMGLDHEKLTYRHSGRDFRLTDVHGTVMQDIIA
jgi:hypothetical protein|tara:strand:- start:73 stop:1479 length:1407 start_codon:yes stop_codon:yes gene_type:complete